MKSMKQQMFISLLIVMLVPFFMLYMLFFVWEEEELMQNIEEHISTSLNDYDQRLTDLDQTIENALVFFTKDERVINLDGSQDSRIQAIDAIYEFDQILKESESIGIGLTDGILLHRHEVWVPDDFDPRTRDWYKDGYEAGGKVSMSAPYESINEGARVLAVTYSLALHDNVGNFKGVIGVDVNLQQLVSINPLDERMFEDVIVVFDEEGQVLIDSRHELLKAQSMKVDKTVFERGKIKRVTYNNKDYYAKVRQNSATGFYVGILVQEMYVDDYFYQSMRTMLYIVGFIIFSIFLHLLYFKRRVLKPFDRLNERLHYTINNGYKPLSMEEELNNSYTQSIRESVDQLMLENDNQMSIINNRVKETIENYEALTLKHSKLGNDFESISNDRKTLMDSWMYIIRLGSTLVEDQMSEMDIDLDHFEFLAVEVAKKVGLDEHRQNIVAMASRLHDIGMTGISPLIVNKIGKYTEEESKKMQEHARIAHDMLKNDPLLGELGSVIVEHHEWFNGGGYPEGLLEDQISVEGRIIAVVDAYMAMISKRPYRIEPMNQDQAIDELQKFSGTQFDPAIVQVFVQLLLED